MTPRSFARRAVLTTVLALAPLAAAPAGASADGRLAYTTNFSNATVSVIDTEQNAIVKNLSVGFGPTDMAITPDGRRGFVTDYFNGRVSAGGAVSVINTRTNETLEREIALDGAPIGIAMAPDGRRAYVSRFSADSVSVINTETLKVVGRRIPVGDQPADISVSPDGTDVYVSNTADGTVSVIDVATRQIVDEIEDIDNPNDTAFLPDGERGYVAGFDSDTLIEFDPQTDEPVGDAIALGDGPAGIAISASGERAYVSNVFDGSVSVVDTLGNETVGDPIELSNYTGDVAVTAPGLRRAYATNDLAETVSVIDTDTNEVSGDPIDVAGGPNSITIAPDQSPLAELSVPRRVQTGEPVEFDGSGSTDDVGVRSYGFDLGNGTDVTQDGPVLTDSYPEPGTYLATLTVDDEEGCPGFVVTGSTPLCNGPSTNSTSVEIVVTDDPPPPLAVDLGVGLSSALRNVIARATCNADCEGTVRGTLEVKGRRGSVKRFPLRAKTFSGEADSLVKVALPIPARSRKQANRALRAGRTVTASVVARATDGFESATARERFALRSRG